MPPWEAILRTQSAQYRSPSKTGSMTTISSLGQQGSITWAELPVTISRLLCGNTLSGGFSAVTMCKRVCEPKRVLTSRSAGTCAHTCGREAQVRPSLFSFVLYVLPPSSSAGSFPKTKAYLFHLKNNTTKATTNSPLLPRLLIYHPWSSPSKTNLNKLFPFPYLSFICPAEIWLPPC